MTKSIKREEYTYKGRRVILDTAQLYPNFYETMLYRASDCLDIDSATATTEAEALDQFDRIRSAHPADKKPAAPTGESDTVKERMESGTHSIRFFYNGIKVNGGKLIRCHYSLDNRHDGRECVTIYSRGHRGDLPRDMFKVVNNSDSYQDYFEDDHTDVFPDHPLYKFVRAAAVSAGIRDMKRFLQNDLEKIGTAADRSGYYTNEAARKKELLSKLEAESVNLPRIPKQQPTAADVEAVHALNLAAETAILAEEKARELAEREKVLNEQNDGRRYIESVSEQYPIVDGDPVVTIHWSEHPAFYSWADDTLKLSIAAADIVLRNYDKEPDDGFCYYKTKFTVDYVEGGVEKSFTDRYDLGDLEGGLVNHIRQCRPGLASLLEAHTAKESAVSVQIAPWFEEAVQRRKEAARERMSDTLDMIGMLTDEQLAAAVLHSPKDKPDVARFFLQELAKRDEKKALSVFRSWQNGEGLEALDEI